MQEKSTKKLGFGCMRLPLLDKDDQKSVDMEQMKKMVDLFLEQGFTYFDTAYMYHDFTSEIAVREALVKRHPRDSFTLATKMPIMAMKTKDENERIFNEQLEKCGVDYFDYYLLHNVNAAFYDNAVKIGVFDFVKKMKDEGKIKKIGFSYHDDADYLDKVLTEHPEVEFVQLQINYLDWNDAGVQSGKCYEVARKHGKPIVVMEPIKGGRLANVPETVKDKFESVNPGMSAASWAIRFAASHEGIITVLSGMSDIDQLKDNISYMKDFKPLNEKEMETIESAVEAIKSTVAVPCTACRYCIKECPKDIQISDYLALYNLEKNTPPVDFPIYGMYYSNKTVNHGKASDCIGCKKCEKVCPQHIKISEWMKEVAKAFEQSDWLSI